MQIDAIEAQWLALCSERSPAKKYFDPTHPLQLLYGADLKGRAMMVLITAEDPDLGDLSRDVKTASSQREDGRWATTWTLTDATLFPTFVRLGVDLVERSGAKSSRSPLEQFIIVLAQWQVLLRPSPIKRLTLEKLRGLMAELWAGETVVQQGRTREELVRAWSGPLGGEQDFTFPTGDVWEVKAKRSKASKVKISSAAQLEPAEKDLRLVVMDLDERVSGALGAESLVDKVQSWRTALASSPAERHLFDLLVSGLGVDLSDPYYEQTHFHLQRTVVYRVDDEFPSLRASALPVDVSFVKYHLDVQGLAPWVTAESEGSA